jgi:hypothetical protein
MTNPVIPIQPSPADKPVTNPADPPRVTIQPSPPPAVHPQRHISPSRADSPPPCSAIHHAADKPHQPNPNDTPRHVLALRMTVHPPARAPDEPGQPRPHDRSVPPTTMRSDFPVISSTFPRTRHALAVRTTASLRHFGPTRSVSPTVHPNPLSTFQLSSPAHAADQPSRAALVRCALAPTRHLKPTPATFHAAPPPADNQCQTGPNRIRQDGPRRPHRTTRRFDPPATIRSSSVHPTIHSSPDDTA